MEENKDKCQAVGGTLKEALRPPNSSSSPSGSMMLRFSKLICSLLTFLLQYIQMSFITFLCKEADKKELRLCCCWHSNNRNETVFLFYEPSEGDSLRFWHFISPNHFYSKIFALAPSAPPPNTHTDLAVGTHWGPLLGGGLSAPKAGLGKKKQHLLYWKTSSYFISWKRNVSANVLKRWLSYIKMSIPKAITPDAISHTSHPEGREQMEPRKINLWTKCLSAPSQHIGR